MNCFSRRYSAMMRISCPCSFGPSIFAASPICRQNESWRRKGPQTTYNKHPKVRIEQPEQVIGVAHNIPRLNLCESAFFAFK